MKSSAELNERLGFLHQRTAESPLFNPVFQLSIDLSRAMESDKLQLDDIGHLVSELEKESLQSRATRLEQLVSPLDGSENEAAFLIIAEESAQQGYDAFAARWASPLLHVVFTAHPTFLLTPGQSDAVARAASKERAALKDFNAIKDVHPSITLDYEHDAAMAAIARAGEARDRLTTLLLRVAAKYWPDRWQALRPAPYRLASWVGYDMDGRTDIGWSTCMRYRLREKVLKLSHYAETLESISPAHPLVAVLIKAEAHTRGMENLFGLELSSPDALSEAANALTTPHPDKLVSLSEIIAFLERDAAAADEETAISLLTLAAAMRTDGLGMGDIHFRANSSQLHNAIRRRIDPDNSLNLASNAALVRLRALIEEEKSLRTNFAALAIENTTAIRQFLIMAQILRHVDADTPIRMLIAECETPQTVLAALYFARLFGVADKVDVSPLFETESAMEHGGRFLDALLSEPAYRSYARRRGRVSIQTGFSDAGRFVGQVPAALAIERLQGQLAHSMKRHDLTDVKALIFNTHGESMGRGAHPAGFADRLTWPMSVWARQQFAKSSIPTEQEVSFQGGDGYLFFWTPELALATLVRIAEAQLVPLPQGDDPFYTQSDLSLDFYRGIRRVQRNFMSSRTYARSLTAFGLGLLNETGSRKSRRQFDLVADREMSLRQIRAIPHNAILQQLGYPVNLIAGVGTAAAGEDLENVAELLRSSHRGRQIIRMLRAADRLASIKSAAAYGELYNSAYWASRPYRGTEPHIESACLALADQLTTDDRNSAFRTLTSRLRVDGLKLHRLLDLIPEENPDPVREDVRRSLGALQALRLALMQFIFLRAVQIPAFSRANDISRDDVLQMIFSLRIEEAVGQLRRAYPVSAPTIADYAVDEPTDYPDLAGHSYAMIQQKLINPIAEAYDLCLRISVAIANYFGAHG